MTGDGHHWERAWTERDETAMSWFEPDPQVSFDLINAHAPAPRSIIDVGGGASHLVDRLLEAGYEDVTVLDVAQTSLDVAQARLGSRASEVTWIAGDATTYEHSRSYAVWHDRAVFHFLTTPEQRAGYGRRAEAAVQVGGSLIISTFALDGPEMCSGLPVARYDRASLADALPSTFEPRDCFRRVHHTPTGAPQPFFHARFERLHDATPV